MVKSCQPGLMPVASKTKHWAYRRHALPEPVLSQPRGFRQRRRTSTPTRLLKRTKIETKTKTKADTKTKSKTTKITTTTITKTNTRTNIRPTLRITLQQAGPHTAAAAPSRLGRARNLPTPTLKPHQPQQQRDIHRGGVKSCAHLDRATLAFLSPLDARPSQRP